MDLSDATDVPRVSDLRAAADVLRPALLLWLLVVGLIGAHAQLWLFLVPDLAASTLLVPLVLLGAYQLAMAIVVVVFARRDRTACRVLARPRRGMVELCLVVGIAGSMLLAMWERNIRWGNPGSTIALEHDAGWPLWATLFTTAVVPAVFEELMYRGVILQRLRALVSLPMAIAMQAMMFSVMHMSMVYVLPHFVFGCLAGLLRSAARALWPCMLMHFLWNSWAVLVQFGWL